MSCTWPAPTKPILSGSGAIPGRGPGSSSSESSDSGCKVGSHSDQSAGEARKLVHAEPHAHGSDDNAAVGQGSHLAGLQLHTIAHGDG